MRVNVKALLKQVEEKIDLCRYEEAKNLLEEILAEDDANVESHYLMGEVLSKLEDFTGSLSHLEKANKLLPDNPRIIHLLGWVMFMDGDAQKGRKLLLQALALLPDDVMILSDLAALENQQENDIKAQEYATRAVTIDPTNPLAQEVYRATAFFSKMRKEARKKLN